MIQDCPVESSRQAKRGFSVFDVALMFSLGENAAIHGPLLIDDWTKIAD